MTVSSSRSLGTTTQSIPQRPSWQVSSLQDTVLHNPSICVITTSLCVTVIDLESTVHCRGGRGLCPSVPQHLFLVSQTHRFKPPPRISTSDTFISVKWQIKLLLLHSLAIKSRGALLLHCIIVGQHLGPRTSSSSFQSYQLVLNFPSFRESLINEKITVFLSSSMRASHTARGVLASRKRFSLHSADRETGLRVCFTSVRF